MFCSEQALKAVTVIALNIALLLLQCGAEVDTIQKFQNGDIPHFFTREPIWRFTLSPDDDESHFSRSSNDAGIIAFYVIIGIFLLICLMFWMYKTNICEQSIVVRSTTAPQSVFGNARRNTPQSLEDNLTLRPPQNRSTTIIFDPAEAQNPVIFSSFLNNDAATPDRRDKPPDYSSVVISDFTNDQFPSVKREDVPDTPPPNYDGAVKLK